MDIFKLTLNQMLLMFGFILIGFFLRKKKILPENAGTVLSRMETYVFVPALNFYNQMTKCTVENFLANKELILYGAALVLISVGVAYPLSSLFIRKAKGDRAKEYQRNIYRYALTFGNYGFMGNYIILGIWGNETFFQYSMLTLVVAMVCNSWGLYVLIPKEEGGRWKNLVKGLTAPPILAIFLGIICGLCNLQRVVPVFLNNLLNNAGACMGPVAMLLAGVVIGGYELKGLFTDVKIYMVTLLRLIVLPSAFLGVMKLLGVGDEVLILALVLLATPLGLNTIVYPATYGGETKPGASMAVISHTLSVVTIPLMYLFWIVLL